MDILSVVTFLPDLYMLFRLKAGGAWVTYILKALLLLCRANGKIYLSFTTWL